MEIVYLKPCPFCGGTAGPDVKFENGYSGLHQVQRVKCQTCHIGTEFSQREIAYHIFRWNKRFGDTEEGQTIRTETPNRVHFDL